MVRKMEKIIKHYTCTVSPTACKSRLGKPQLGFTLIELMVVVAIIAIIAAIAFPSYQAYTRRSSESLAQQEMQKIANYYVQNPHTKPSNVIAMQIQHIFNNNEIRNYCGAGLSLSCINDNGDKYPFPMYPLLSFLV